MDIITDKSEKLFEFEKNGYKYIIKRDLVSNIEYAEIVGYIDKNKEKIDDLADAVGGTCISYNNKEYTIREIGSTAFYTNKCKEIIIPDTVQVIEYGAFMLCADLKKIHLPKELKIIDSYTFFGCYHIDEITIPDNVTTIEKSAFEQCFELRSLNIPKNIKTIDIQAFCNCRSLAEIHGIENLNNSEVEVGDYAFSGCNTIYENKSYYELLKKKNENAFTIPPIPEDD